MRPGTFRRASGIGRSASRATGTGSRVASALGIAAAWCMGNALHGVVPLISMRPHPPGLDVADDGLAAFVDVDVLDRDLLLALAAVAIEGFEQRCVCP